MLAILTLQHVVASCAAPKWPKVSQESLHDTLTGLDIAPVLSLKITLDQEVTSQKCSDVIKKRHRKKIVV